MLKSNKFDIIGFFAESKNRIFQKKLLEMIWTATGKFINDNTFTVYIKRLRNKIETKPQEPKIILTVRGLDYKADE